jgi:hypothetical protein
MEPDIHTVYTLCNDGQGDAEVGPLSVFKRAILQLLKVYPELVLTPENLEKLSLQRFQAVGKSPEAAYSILVDILKMVDVQCLRNEKQVFLLIDRVDVLLKKETSLEKQRFLESILQLNREYKTLRVIVTSRFRVEDIKLEKAVEGLLEVWVDTTKPLIMHSRQ